MAAQIPPEDNSRPHEELGPELRDAVESVLHDDPPADWSEEVFDRLRRRSPRTAPRSSRRLVVWMALVAAACVVAFVMLNRSGVQDDGRQHVEEVPKHEEIQRSPEGRVPAPTLLAYQTAARRSPEALDALLDRHAEQLLPPSPDDELADVMKGLL